MEPTELQPRVDLSGRTALVTGSSRGLGAATARRLAAMGADVVVTYRKEADAAEAVAAELRSAGRWSATRELDMAEPDSIDACFDWIETDGPGALDLFVANAAATSLRPLLEQRPHNVRRTFDVCVTGFLHATQRAVPLMERRGGGRIVAVSGIDTHNHAPGHGLLGGAKAAMETFVKYLNVELLDRNITAIAVNPTSYAGDSVALMLGDYYEPMQAAIRDLDPRGMPAVETIAEAVALCCTDAATWMAGNTVHVDGGTSFALQGQVIQLLGEKVIAQGTEIADRGTSVPGA